MLNLFKSVTFLGVCFGVIVSEKIQFKPEAASDDNKCVTPKGDTGKCISIHVCPALLGLIMKRDQQEFLRQSQCGWEQDSPMVCCADESSTTETQNCIASDLKWCESDQDVCCIPQLTYNIDVNKNSGQMENSNKCELSSQPPDLSSGCCGKEATVPRTIPGEITAIDQYPWTAIIEYEATGIVELKCGGALISGRYVLTSAFCVSIDSWTPVKVRLGEFDVDNPGRDCVETSGDVDCTDEAVTIGIEMITPHPDYAAESRSQTDDIALIRMKSDAPYTDFIRPICLPSATRDLTTSSDANSGLYVAGWGIRSNAQNYNQLKHQEKQTLVSAEDCFMSYRRLSLLLSESQICANDEKGTNSCKGDSGGPLMLKKNQTTEIIGVASFTSCGRTNRPAVFTEVRHYLPWIRSVIH